MRTLTSLVLSALLCSCAGLDGAAGPQSPSSTTGKAADFALGDLDGNTVRLSDYKGKVVLLNFWATWCSPCASEQPHLEKLYRSYKDRGFVVLAVSMDGPETIAEVAPLVRSRGLTFPVLLDTETRVTGSMNPRRAAPFTLVIGRDGTIAWQKASFANGDADEVEGVVQRML
jgi:peroxiredoxin